MIKKIFSNELFKGSIVLLVLLNLFNVFNVIFHFISARLLGAEDYGILATLLGIAFILGIPSEAIQTIISRYTTKFHINKESPKIKNLIKKSYKKFALISLIGIIILTFSSPFIGNFLSIDYKIILLMNFLLIGAFFIPINRGILQGQKKFYRLGISLSSESVLKVVFLIILVSFGLRVYGAIGAIIIGFAISFVISFFFIKKILKVKSSDSKIKGIYSYSWIVLVTTGCIILFYSMDIILAKRFFSAEDVGLYAAISILGKTLFWTTSPISKAMFPLISEKRDKKESSRGIIKRSLAFVFGLCFFGILFFWFFPEFIIKIFYGSTYLKFANLLLYFAIAMTFLALTNIFVHNAISHKRKINLVLIFFVILQAALLYLFHSTILEFIFVLILTNLLTLLFFIFDYLLSINKEQE